VREVKKLLELMKIQVAAKEIIILKSMMLANSNNIFIKISDKINKNKYFSNNNNLIYSLNRFLCTNFIDNNMKNTFY